MFLLLKKILRTKSSKGNFINERKYAVKFYREKLPNSYNLIKDIYSILPKTIVNLRCFSTEIICYK